MQRTSPLFLDIETVPCVAHYTNLPQKMQELWAKKAQILGAVTKQEIEDLFLEKAGIFSEFGKVIVIALGYISQNQEGKESIHIQGLAEHQEGELLEQCANILNKMPKETLLAGHNSKEFDFPYLCRRMVVHGINLPRLLDLSGKKPWEVNHVDTLELWKFGDRKNYTSLDLLTTILGIPSSKENMAGNQVSTYYYQHEDLLSIEKYCMSDVVATIQLYRRLKGLPLISIDHLQQKISHYPKK